MSQPIETRQALKTKNSFKKKNYTPQGEEILTVFRMASMDGRCNASEQPCNVESEARTNRATLASGKNVHTLFALVCLFTGNQTRASQHLAGDTNGATNRQPDAALTHTTTVQQIVHASTNATGNSLGDNQSEFA